MALTGFTSCIVLRAYRIYIVHRPSRLQVLHRASIHAYRFYIVQLIRAYSFYIRAYRSFALIGFAFALIDYSRS